MKLAVVLVPALLWATPVRADDTPAIRALLADPGQLAAWLRDRDPMIESAKARIEAAQEQGQQARVFPNPQLQGGVGGIALGDPNKFQTMEGPTSFDATANYFVGIGELFEIGKRGPRQ